METNQINSTAPVATKDDEEEDKQSDREKGEFQPRKKYILCIVGVEKYYTEKELIKFLRRYMESAS